VRIHFVGPVPPLPGGIAQHSGNLVDALRDAGHTVDVTSWTRQYPSLLYRGSQETTGDTPDPRPRFDLKWWSISSWFRARRRTRSADLLVFPYVTPFHALSQWLISTGAQSVAVFVHNATPHEQMPMQGVLARLAMSNAARIVVQGDEVAADLRKIGIDTDIVRVDLPPTLSVIATALPPVRRLKLLFFGFVRPYKGVPVAVESLRYLSEMGIDAELTVMGDFWEPVEVFEKSIEELDLQSRVNLIPGYASDQDLREALETHHLVVVPYVADTRSAIVPVAFAAGRPVVASRVEGLSAQVDEGRNGVLVDPGSPRALAVGVKAALSDLEALARGAAATSASWETVAAAVTGNLGDVNRS